MTLTELFKDLVHDATCLALELADMQTQHARSVRPAASASEEAT